MRPYKKRNTIEDSDVRRDAKGRFAKGHKGGTGRVPLSKETHMKRRESLEDRLLFTMRVLNMTERELRLLEKEKDKLTLGEIWVLESYLKKDFGRIQYHENRLWGRPLITLDVDAEIKVDVNCYRNLTDDELIRLLDNDKQS